MCSWGPIKDIGIWFLQADQRGEDAVLKPDAFSFTDFGESDEDLDVGVSVCVCV